MARLEAARAEFERATRRIDETVGDVAEAADAYEQAADLLDSYVDRATGTGRENFKAYVQLEGQFATLVENLPDDLAEHEAFEAALDAIDKRRLTDSDFERAEAALEPAGRYADLIDERESARDELAAARTAASKRLRELDDEIENHERLLELADVDFDAPVSRLREPIETYDERIREAFEDYYFAASAREVFALLERSRWYPFVAYKRPPADLATYVREDSAGEYTIPELLEYADYSRSKLDHYVADADELKRRVATQQTFLDGISPDPLTVGWPPEPAGVLRRRTREIRPFVERIADEETVAALRTIRSLTREDDYARLQRAAAVRDSLTPAERERLADGDVETTLTHLREERASLGDALDENDPV
ncbi:hypothetical protein OB905_13370 [Halobacteria archaeon AArc-dxtr1]|nr:hypothetical protein [Halobacteria archaeon AArc-dxtr1]